MEQKHGLTGFYSGIFGLQAMLVLVFFAIHLVAVLRSETKTFSFNQQAEKGLQSGAQSADIEPKS